MASEHVGVARWHRDLLPHIVDRLARETPDKLYGQWPVDPTSYTSGILSITYSQLANTINGLAAWIVCHLGHGKDNDQGQDKDAVNALAYIGPNDVRSTALLLAAIKAGYVIFFDSPRNSAAAHRALFDSLKCKTLLTDDPLPPAAQLCLDALDGQVQLCLDALDGQVQKLVMPSVKELLKNVNPHFEYTKTYEEGRWDPVWIIHTSGTTGLPKPIIWTQESMSRNHNSSGLKAEVDVPAVDNVIAGKRTLNTFPSFHGGGLGQFLFYAIPFGNVINVPTSHAIVTANGLVEALEQMPSDVAFVIPSVVADLAQNPTALDYVAANVEILLYMGGDLPQAQGNIVASRIALQCRWGQTEMGLPQQIIPKNLDRTKDWKYICFHPDINPIFEKIDNEFYELIFKRDRKQEKIGDSVQVTFATRGFEHLDDYRTKDLFEPHSSVPNCWRWRARLDDIIVFLNGEKTNPVSMEQHVTAQNPELGGVLVVGAQRFQAAMIIDPKVPVTTTAEQAALIERVWPSIEEANKEAPAHARVEKSFILVTSPGRPLPRAGKGTLVRAPSIAQYTEEINKLYANAEQTYENENDDTINMANSAAVSLFIKDCVRDLTGMDPGDGGFFDQGMDSLQALRLTRILRKQLHYPDLNMSTIYQHPTTMSLTAAIMTQKTKETSNDRELMDSLFATYQDLIIEMQKPDLFDFKNISESSQNVLLTGSTGVLGTFILHSLLKHPGIRHIFCLNRAADGGREIQINRLKNMGISQKDFNNRVTFLHGNTATPLFNLDETVYSKLKDNISLIIHNAWPVNFNLNLAAFRPQLAGLINPFSLTKAAAPRPVHFVFISSMGVTVNADIKPAPEQILANFDSAAASGYARSKIIAEHLCDTASRHLGISTTVARLGQIAGTVGEFNAGEAVVWNRHEWFPSLVISAAHIGCLPESLGPIFSAVDWVPSDILGEVVLDLALDTSTTGLESKGSRVFHVRNPRVTSWTKLLPAVQSELEQASGGDKKVDIIPASDWIARLQKSMGDTVEAANPAVKLYEFYEQTVWSSPDGIDAKAELMAVEKSVGVSKSLRELSAVTPEWARKWVQEWMTMNT